MAQTQQTEVGGPPPAVGQDAVRMTGISKSFGGVRALNRVDFSVRYGEIHALLGENGAGGERAGPAILEYSSYASRRSDHSRRRDLHL